MGENAKGGRVADQDRAAQCSAAIEAAADVGPMIVDSAEQCKGIQGDTRAIAALFHAPYTLVLDDERFGYMVDPLGQLDRLMAAGAATGAGRDVVVERRHARPATNAHPGAHRRRLFSESQNPAQNVTRTVHFVEAGGERRRPEENGPPGPFHNRP
jgi:hypothetical protein